MDGEGVPSASGEVDVMVPGTYTITYNHTDYAGNKAIPAIRNVTVVDTTAPTITINGDANITHEAGFTYDDAHAIWTDLVDGSGVVHASGVVDIHTPGRYFLFYDYSDSQGNAADRVSREILVYNTAPENLDYLSILEVEENKPIGTMVGQFSAFDRNGNALTYHLVEGAGSEGNPMFALQSSGVLTTNAVFDFESHASMHAIRVQARDEYNGTVEGSFSVTLLDIFEDLDGDGIEDHLDEDMDGDGYTNEEEFAYPSNPRDANSVANATPQDLDFLASLDVFENKKPGMPVGKLTGTETGTVQTFELVAGDGDDHNNLFTLQSSGLIAAAQSFDYEGGFLSS